MGQHSRPTASPQLILCLIFSAILVLLLTLILVSPFNHLFPLIPPAYYLTPSSSTSSWSHPDRKHNRIFTENDALFFHDPPTHPPDESHQTWEEILMPSSGGGILALHPPTGGEADQEEDNTIISYGISMFHQLHCLIALRGVIFPETSHKHHNSTSKAHSGDHGQDRWHWAHCFDYRAQVFLSSFFLSFLLFLFAFSLFFGFLLS